MTTRDPQSSSSSSENETPPSGPLALAPVIRQVIAKWRADAAFNPRETSPGYSHGLQKCADELEAAARRVLGGAPEKDLAPQVESRPDVETGLPLQRETGKALPKPWGNDSLVADEKGGAPGTSADSQVSRVLGGAQTGDEQQEHEDSAARVGQTATASTVAVPQPPTE